MFVKPDVRIGGTSPFTVLLSVVVHTVMIAAVLIVPLVATDTIVLPPRLAMLAFSARPPLPPSPPLPRGAVREQLTVAKSTIPLESPPSILPESPIQAISQSDIAYSTGIVPGIELSVAPPAPTPVPAPLQTVYATGGDIKPPKKIKDVAPVYPAGARAAHVEGFVIIEATIGPDGKVQNARVLRPAPLLDDAALDAVGQWEYTPTLLNGVPIAIVMTVTITFRLR